MPFFFLSRTQYYLEEPVVFVGYQLCMVGAGPCSFLLLLLLRCVRRAACTGPPKLMLMTVGRAVVDRLLFHNVAAIAAEAGPVQRRQFLLHRLQQRRRRFR